MSPQRFALKSRFPVSTGNKPARSGTADAGVAKAPLPDFETGFEEAADLYYRKASRGLEYRHFDSVGAAVHFARDNLSAPQIMGAVLQVGEDRFEGAEVAAMVRQLLPAASGKFNPRLDG